jgi:hypothetical protein
MKTMRRALLFCLVFSFALPLCAATVDVTALDATGAAFPDVLVIFRSLEGEGEVLRALTDREGSVPAFKAPPGLYQVIATCPYGICKTLVKEVLVQKESSFLALTLKVDVIGTGHPTPASSAYINLQVSYQRGEPAAGVGILARNVRDTNPHFRRWYKTDSSGKARVELLGNPTVLVFIYDGNLFTRELGNPADPAQAEAWNKCLEKMAMPAQEQELEIRLP